MCSWSRRRAAGATARVERVNLNQITLPTRDVAASAAFYRALGCRQIVEALPRYARFESPDGEATFSLHLHDVDVGDSGVVLYFECDDVDRTWRELAARGVVFDQPPRDEPWLWREARLRDPAGNRLCLYHAGSNRRHPPWRLPEAGLG